MFSALCFTPVVIARQLNIWRFVIDSLMSTWLLDCYSTIVSINSLLDNDPKNREVSLKVATEGRYVFES
jgi:hypothetical protein